MKSLDNYCGNVDNYEVGSAGNFEDSILFAAKSLPVCMLTTTVDNWLIADTES